MKALFLLFLLVSCSRHHYEDARPEEAAAFKEVAMPFPSGQKFTVFMIPFRDGNDHYAWSFGVPFGTPVTAIDDGKVIFVHEPEGGGGCDAKKYEGKGHFLKVLHGDGTVSQYLHIRSHVKVDDVVKKGQVIAETANTGIVCGPNLYFRIWKTINDNPNGGDTVPARFKGLPDILPLNYSATVP